MPAGAAVTTSEVQNMMNNFEAKLLRTLGASGSQSRGGQAGRPQSLGVRTVQAGMSMGTAASNERGHRLGDSKRRARSLRSGITITPNLGAAASAGHSDGASNSGFLRPLTVAHAASAASMSTLQEHGYKSRRYFASNEEWGSEETAGIQFMRSRYNEGDGHEFRSVKWGEIISAFDIGDGWLAVQESQDEILFLPTHMDGERVLFPASDDRHTLMQGSLMKLAAVEEWGWAHRYVELKDGVVEVYGRDRKTLKSSISLGAGSWACMLADVERQRGIDIGHEIVNDVLSSYPNCFVIAHALTPESPLRMVFFEAQSTDESRRWVRAMAGARGCSQKALDALNSGIWAPSRMGVGSEELSRVQRQLSSLSGRSGRSGRKGSRNFNRWDQGSAPSVSSVHSPSHLGQRRIVGGGSSHSGTSGLHQQPQQMQKGQRPKTCGTMRTASSARSHKESNATDEPKECFDYAVVSPDGAGVYESFASPEQLCHVPQGDMLTIGGCIEHDGATWMLPDNAAGGVIRETTANGERVLAPVWFDVEEASLLFVVERAVDVFRSPVIEPTAVDKVPPGTKLEGFCHAQTYDALGNDAYFVLVRLVLAGGPAEPIGWVPYSIIDGSPVLEVPA